MGESVKAMFAMIRSHATVSNSTKWQFLNEDEQNDFNKNEESMIEIKIWFELFNSRWAVLEILYRLID